MKKGNQRSIRQERIIMVTSSIFVLGALTLTGVYMRNQTKQSQDDGYTIDFTALEDRAEEKRREIAQKAEMQQKQEQEPAGQEIAMVPDEDLDYYPMEAGSSEIRIPGLTEAVNEKPVDASSGRGMSEGADEKKFTPIIPEKDRMEEQLPKEPEPVVETAMDSPIISEELHFTADDLIRPVSGEVLIRYSMNGSVYFATLDQYKYNPAVIYSAEQGEEVAACATGRVLSVQNDPELGHVLVLDLGDGYEAVYGQLENIDVPVGSVVEAGSRIATVAAPTKYFSVEGSNLYFQIKKDGVTLDPESFFHS